MTSTDERASLQTMTTTAPAEAEGSRARARTERPPRCERPKIENGRPCKRAAGGGTDHPGFGPCALHDDGSWEMPSFADNETARLAFLEGVKTNRGTGIRDLVEPLGYRRRDVTQLLAADPEFEDDYMEARGYDPDTIRTELSRRALAGMDDSSSARLLEFEARMRLPEAQALQRQRIDGRLEVTAVDVRLVFQPTFADAPQNELEPGDE